jgi:hypothetical protein
MRSTVGKTVPRKLEGPRRRKSSMTSRKNPSRGKDNKPKLRKETLKDLDAKAKSGRVKGGVPIVQYTVLFCTTVCFPPQAK